MGHVVVIGAGQAGSSCVAKLRNSGFEGKITLIGAETVPPYQRPPLSKAYLLGDMALERLYLRPESFYADHGIDLMLGTTVDSIDPAAQTVRVNGGDMAYDDLVLTTGSFPRRLPAHIGGDLAGVHVVRDLMDVDTMGPRFTKGARVLIVGGGYIACEFACIMNGLGVKTTQFYRGAQILRGFDEEARGLVSEEMLQNGVDLHLGTNVLEMKKVDDGIWVKATNGQEYTVDQVMFATGRAPNSKDLGLEEIGVKLGRGGQIEVDEYSQTAVPSVYAIGDVTNRVNLTPVAIREGMAFVETVFKGNPTPVDHEMIPSAIFTQPEMGTVGLSEEAAREREPIEVYCTSFRPMHTAFIGKSDRVMMKLVVSQESRKVLGCHIVAPQAGEMIQLAGIAVKMGATKEDFDRTVAVHPTMSEEIVTMRTPVRTG